MTSSNNKDADNDKWIQWIENGFSNNYINYHEYDEFQNIQRIGSGAFSDVYKANWKSSNTVVALKSFRSEVCIMKEIVNELQLLHSVHFHTNIIRWFGITKRKNNEGNMEPDYSFIFEYADSGTLRDYLKNNFNKLDWNAKLQFAIQIADAVSCIHYKDIIHRDLHSGNILVHQNIIKLADFGLSRRLNELSDPSKYFLGKISYVDPQHFKCQKASKKSDVYSVGVLLWEISSGQKPFESYDSFPIVLMNEISDGKRETPVSDTPIDYINIYKRCWQDNPNDRPDMQQVFSELKSINLTIDNTDEVTLLTCENVNTIEDNIMKNNDDNSLNDSLQINLDKVIKYLRQTNEIEQSRESKRIKISHSAVNLSSESLEKIAKIFFSNTKLEDESSYQPESKFIPRKLKDCPDTDCGKPRIPFGWLKECEINSMKNFPCWTSGNKDIDKLIQYIQLNATKSCDYLEWILFEEIKMVKHIESRGFSHVYSALWTKGPRWIWDDSVQEWTRNKPKDIILKRLNNSQNISSSYINQQIKAFHKCLQSTFLAKIFGITKDPTSDYMIVMKYYEKGNLYQYLDRSNGILSWKDMIDIFTMLRGIAGGLEDIHTEGKVHGNLHGGNLLIEEENDFIYARIGDVGLHGPCNYDENRKVNQIYGVLPYVAPEVLRGESYSTASDIYSFGIIMNTLATGKRPWCNRAHDINLAKDICDGKRLEIPEEIPKYYIELMQQCWDNDPEKRPTASYLNEKLGEWITSICDDPNPSDEISITDAELTQQLLDNDPDEKLGEWIACDPSDEISITDAELIQQWFDNGPDEWIACDKQNPSDEISIAEEKGWEMISHPEMHPEAYYTSRLLYFPIKF